MESPAGSSGGSAEGASEGRQPLTGPHLPPAAQAAQTKVKKSPRACGHSNHHSNGKPCFTFFKSARRAYPRYATPPRRRPKLKQSKAPVSAGHRSHRSKDKPCFVFLECVSPQPRTQSPAAQAAQTKTK